MQAGQDTAQPREDKAETHGTTPMVREKGMYCEFTFMKCPEQATP
jgi:hypothetical protein